MSNRRKEFSSRTHRSALCLLAILVSTASTTFADESRESEPPSSSAPTQVDPSALLGVDANGNGVRDDLERASLPARTSKVDGIQPSEGSPVSDQIARAFDAAGSRGPTKPQRTCMDFLLLEPEQQRDAELTRRQLPNQYEGGHPCDPVVPPLYDSPLDTPYIELSIPRREHTDDSEQQTPRESER